MSRVYVAMSGGVDSSVAAALLLEAGHDVTGVTMQLWPSGDVGKSCCSVDAARLARRACDALGIPHYVLNFREIFEREVVSPCADAYASGATPNPCIECNDRVKFEELWRRAAQQGADYLATGHYGRLLIDETGQWQLHRAVDSAKDQSYFLYRMTQEHMSRTLFPLGELTKVQVREHAVRLGLPTASAAESQDLCFTEDSYLSTVAERRPDALREGRVVDLGGRQIATHQGIARFTVGQRRGLGLRSARRYYVTAIRPESAEVVVGDRADLAVSAIEARHAVWHGPAERQVGAVLRYRARPIGGTARAYGRDLRVDLTEPAFGVAPGQAVVCYAGTRVLGGGVVCRTE